MAWNGLQIAGNHIAVEVVFAYRADKNASLVTKASKKIAALHANSKTPEWIEEEWISPLEIMTLMPLRRSRSMNCSSARSWPCVR